MDVQKLSDEIEDISVGYCKKFSIIRDPDWFLFKFQEEVGELTQSYLMMRGKARQKGKTAQQIREDFEGEMADVFCHYLLIAKHFHVDIEKALDKKWLQWKK